MSRTIDPYDELAAMFLSSPRLGATGQASASHPEGAPSEQTSGRPAAPAAAFDSSVSSAAEPKPSARVPTEDRNATTLTELLLVGHLPVRAGLWLTPYADALAGEAGCVALVRMDLAEPTVQVLHAPEEFAAPDSRDTFANAIHAIAPHVDMWLLRVPSGSDPVELLQSRADRVTILSSADEAAVVAAYQLIKDLGSAAEKSNLPLPPIGLAIVGSDPRTAASVLERLNRTTHSFLGIEVSLVACLPRMDAGIRSSGYVSFADQPVPAVREALSLIYTATTEASESPPARELSDVVGSLYTRRDAAAVPALERFSAAREQPEEHASIRVPSVQRSGLPRSTSAHDASAASADELSELLRAAVVRPTEHAPSAQVKLHPKPVQAAVHAEPKPQEPALQPREPESVMGLCTHVSGLTPLPLRAPGCSNVELAADAEGRLHLLCRDQALRELFVGEAWARSNRELLVMAFPRLAGLGSERVTKHLFTAAPATVADLHASGIQLHVLAPVTVDGRTGWYCAPLNNPAM